MYSSVEMENYTQTKECLRNFSGKIFQQNLQSGDDSLVEMENYTQTKECSSYFSRKHFPQNLQTEGDNNSVEMENYTQTKRVFTKLFKLFPQN